MKRHIFVVSVLMVTMMLFAGIVSAEEAGCLQTTDNWIIRVYSEGTTSPFTFTLAVIDPVTGNLVDHSGIKAFAGATTPCLNSDRATSHLCEIEIGAQSPDISLGCDSVAGIAYIIHDHAGQLTIGTIPDIVKYVVAHPVIQVTPASLSFGKILTTAKTMKVTVTNTGTSDLHISSVTSPLAPFSKIAAGGDTCTGATIAPATGSCIVAIKFAPTTYGTFTGSFTINSDGDNATVQLTGSK